MKEIYLDHSATTRVYPEVAEQMMKIMTEQYGNPSSMHGKGLEAEKCVTRASETLASLMKVEPKELIYTSGGTESDNLAIIGMAEANKRKGNHLITTEIEHPAVTNTMKYLETKGYSVTYLPVDSYGRVRAEDFEKAVREDTILASVMFVNNEIGAVEPVEELAKILHTKRPWAVFHTDAVQAFGKYRILPKRMGIDAMSVSAHKIGGPKGAGLLYVKDGVKIQPISYGGGQQKGMRSGTHNVPGIAGLALAASITCKNMEEKNEALYARKAAFIQALGSIEGVYVNGAPGKESAPHIVSASFAGIDRVEVLLHALEGEGIYVSAGSACASNHPEISRTLLAIGLAPEFLQSTLRFSMGYETTEEELMETVEALKRLLPMLRRFQKR
ncbi:MAG: cysteine desulfurase [Lachnospiraceae bacterium]|nr:cysteine desulfurase [Lachnospiraceae bacterium]